MKKRLISIIIVISIVALCFTPFFINELFCIATFNPLINNDYKVISEKLVSCLYPEIHSSYISASKKSNLNFGKYDISFTYEKSNNKGTEYETIINQYNNGKSGSNNFDYIIKEKYSISKENFIPNDSLWESIENENYYNVFFKLKDQLDGSTLLNEDLYNEYQTSGGEKLITSVVFEVEDEEMLFCLNSPKKKMSLSCNDSSLFTLFKFFNENKTEISFLCDLKLFNRIDKINFSSLAEKARFNSSAIGFIIYGKGTELKEFKNNDKIQISKIS